MVDWRIRSLADRRRLNQLHHGGRVPRQVLGSESQAVAGLYVPWSFRRPGPLARDQSAERLK